MPSAVDADELTDAPARPGSPVAWAVVASVLALAGLGLSIYLTVEHYSTHPSFACPTTGVIDCVKVTTSSYSKIAGFPVAVLGLAYFGVAVALHNPWAWRSASRILRAARLAWSVLGVGMVFWLVFVEVVRLDAVCLYCTGVHIASVALFVVTAMGTAATAPEGQPTERQPGTPRYTSRS